MRRLEGKVALVTGGGAGIGRATARLFARHGARVMVADLDGAAAEAAAEALRAEGGEAQGLAVDVSQAAETRRMAQATVDRFGAIDVLFNCAGILRLGTVMDTDEETWRRLLAVNLDGVFFCCRAVLPTMIARRKGSIINMSSSTGAEHGIGNAAAYVASKGGVTLLTRAMAIDHAPQGIRVNALAPGPTRTEMISRRPPKELEAVHAFVARYPMGRLGEPDEVAAAALFLASDDSSFVTGVVLPVDGGQTAGV